MLNSSAVLNDDDLVLKDADILPDSRAKTVKNRISIKGTTYIPIFCANCGADGGGVPEENMTFVMYLCNSCCEKWGHIAGTYAEPDAVFFAKVKQAQIEKYGRVLEPEEMVKALDDVNSTLSKLAREAPKGQ
jgi:hypothetical protein